MTKRRSTVVLVGLLGVVGTSACFEASQADVVIPAEDAGSRVDSATHGDGAMDAGSDARATQGDGDSIDVRSDGAAGDGASGDGASGDGASGDGGVRDGAVSDGGAATGCGARETCNNGLDDDCNGRVDEGCACVPGQTQRCFVGAPGTAGVGACSAGMARCEGSGEFGSWSACSGAGAASDEVCDGLDNDCDGTTDESLARDCYGGPDGTAGVGVCTRGRQTCTMGAWGACAGAVTPGEEVCDGVDNDCDGATDESLTRDCYGGPDGTAGVGACRRGTQACAMGMWGACAGAVTPGEEVCDGADNDCDGTVDESLTRACYSGPMGTLGVGRCVAGTQTCTAGAWGLCAAMVGPVTEICRNMIDDDCDGMVDEDCAPCIAGMVGSSPWQMHRVMGPVCFGRSFSTHGEAGEYELASIPTAADAGWRAVTSATIDFAESSALCGRSCSCLNGGEFTYFQTFFEVSAGYAVTSLTVSMGGVDDGARVTVFNSRYPTGVVDPGSYILLGGSGVTTNLARYIVPGVNRVVITHIDDCCSDRSLTGVRVVLNGAPLTTCP